MFIPYTAFIRIARPTIYEHYSPSPSSLLCDINENILLQNSFAGEHWLEAKEKSSIVGIKGRKIFASVVADGRENCSLQ
jgi:hypothetical protein